MKVAKFWVRERGFGEKSDGSEYQLVSWGGSNTSIEQARDTAIDKLRRWQANLRSGRALGEYSYGERDQIREELIAEHYDENGELVAAITRNRYGALVLNSANVLFADVDLPMRVIYYREPGWLGKLIGRLSGSKPEDNTRQAVQKKARDELRARFVQFQASHPTLCVRVYETAAGFRLVIANDLFSPDSDLAKQYLTELGSDPLYRKLCINQSCFRARLSPKPWRCGLSKPSDSYPRETEASKASFKDWLARYESVSEKFVVCRQVDSLGGVANHPVVTQVLALHDEYCVKAARLKLA
jgi:hypothetical protein